MEEPANQELAWTHATSKESKIIKQTTTSKGSMSIMEEDSMVEVMDQDVVVARQAEMRQLHVTALEEVMSVNSFFTAAVFIGLSFNASQTTSLVSNCIAGDEVAKHLVVSEVTAFSCFLFSTLIAQGLKLQMTLTSLKFSPPPLLVHHHHPIKNTLSTPPRRPRPRLLRPFATHPPMHSHPYPHHINPTLLHIGMILSALGSIVGTIFLMLAMFNVIQIRLGLFSCDSPWAKRAVYPLFTLVSAGVLSFISPVLYTVITYK